MPFGNLLTTGVTALSYVDARLPGTSFLQDCKGAGLP